jgi:hypothetical protein
LPPSPYQGIRREALWNFRQPDWQPLPQVGFRQCYRAVPMGQSRWLDMPRHTGGTTKNHGNKAITNHSNHAPLRSSLFISSVRIVARPVSVRPAMVCWSSIQPKCASQACMWGLNNAASAPVSGSIPDTLSAFAKLHEAQANARLSGVSGPPCTNGWICSRWKR